MSKDSQVGQHSRSLAIMLAICCLVSISAHVLIVGVEGKKDKDKGKGGNMVLMMGGGGGGGKGGGYGGGGGGGYGGGGGGGGYPMPIPMPMPMFCPPSFGRGGGAGGGRKGGGKGGAVKEKIVIVPIPAQMLSGDKGGGGGYGREAPASSGYGGSEGGGGGGYSMAEMPVIMMPAYGSKGGGGGGDYGAGSPMRGYGAMSKSGGRGGYGAASHAYAIELSPLSSIVNWEGAVDNMEYPLDQYASNSYQRQTAMREAPMGGFDTTESSYPTSDHSADQFDLQAAASGENSPPTSKHADPASRSPGSSPKTDSLSSGESRKSRRRRK